MGPNQSDHNKWLITFTMITLSGFNCISKSQLNFHKSFDFFLFYAFNAFLLLYAFFTFLRNVRIFTFYDFLLFYAMCRRQNPGGMNENPSAPVANIAEA
jgi:hypothetical protein